VTECNAIKKLTLSEISEILDCEIVLGLDSLDVETALVLSSDMMSDVLAFAQPGALMITGLTNSQSVRTADFADAAAVLYIRGKMPEEKTIQLAEELKIPILSTKMGMFDVCGVLYAEGLRGVC
jgi:predicted transcriptional regulator